MSQFFRHKRLNWSALLPISRSGTWLRDGPITNTRIRSFDSAAKSGSLAPCVPSKLGVPASSLGNVFPRTFDVVRPAASDAIMDRLGFTPLLVSLIQTSTRPLPGVHMNAIGVSSTLSVPYSSLGRFPTVSRHGGVGGDDIHQRRRQAVIGFEAELLEPRPDLAHPLRREA